jgi:ADP-heptose:LPS heptosyltransferase
MEEKRIGLVLACEGLGDNLYCIPVIKRLRELVAAGTRVDVFTRHPGLFRACPYVDKVFPMSDKVTLDAYPHEKHTVFDPKALPFALMETMDFISIPLGIGQLSFRQKQLEYFPVEADQAERYDVVLNTSETWPTRSWAQAHWQRLADELLARGLSVAVVGKDVHSTADKSLKRSAGLAGCVDLTNRLSLDQTYFTIARCGLFVTCQTGLSVLAGSTDAEIIVLDQSIEWSKRAIYRHEDPHYKVTCVKGECSIYCCVSFDCPLPEGEKLKCVPSYERVREAVLEKLPRVVE